jgi:hypothetical protein
VKNVIAICLILLIDGVAATQNRDRTEDIRERFAGAWRLAWLERPEADGKLHRMDCCGLFVFTRDGHASVQVMERNPRPQAAAQQYSLGGYEASWGVYTVDERARTFTFHIEGALVRSLIGKDLTRSYEFSGKTTHREVSPHGRALERRLGTVLTRLQQCKSANLEEAILKFQPSDLAA